MNRKENFKLFMAFFRIGLFTFGGGYAMLPMIQREIVDKYKWATDEEVLDCYAIGQSTPGVIAVNTATFIGYKMGKVKSAIIATLGVIIPSIIIMTILASIIYFIRDNIYVEKALKGISACVVALIAIPVINMGKKAIINKMSVVVFLAGLILLFIFNVSPMLIVIFTIVIASIYAVLKEKKNDNT